MVSATARTVPNPHRPADALKRACVEAAHLPAAARETGPAIITSRGSTGIPIGDPNHRPSPSRLSSLRCQGREDMREDSNHTHYVQKTLNLVAHSGHFINSAPFSKNFADSRF